MPRKEKTLRGRQGETRAKTNNTSTLNKAEILKSQILKNRRSSFWEKIMNVAGEFKLSLGLVFRILFATKVGVVLMLLLVAVPMTAFEAHVVNVTATIERKPGKECPALSIGYWRNHDGCENGGGGSTIWETQVQALSAGFSGAFASTTGSQMCGNLWIPNCPSGNTVESKLCKARAQILGNELNVVSGKLDLTAVIAGAYDGDSGFTSLGLNGNSTVNQALAAVEGVIVNPSSTIAQLTGAAHVSARIYNFYEDENTQAPMCLYTWSGGGGIGAPLVGTEPDGGTGDDETIRPERPLKPEKPGKPGDDENLTGLSIDGANILEAVSDLIVDEETPSDSNEAPLTSEDVPASEPTSAEEPVAESEPVVESTPEPAPEPESAPAPQEVAPPPADPAPAPTE